MILCIILLIVGKKVQLYRYIDPVLGPRKIPVPNILSSNRLVSMNETDLLSFEEASPLLNLTTKDGGKENTINIGNNILYIVD